MAKPKKKRSKKYQGIDAAHARPKVTRVSAVSRRPLHQWIYEKQRLLKAIGVAILVLGVITLVIVGIVGLFHR